MAFYTVVSPTKVYVDYGAGVVLGFTTGAVFDAPSDNLSVTAMLRAYPPVIVAFTPSTAFTAAAAGVAGGSATLDGTGKIPASQLPDTDALDTEVTAAVAAHAALADPHAVSTTLPKWIKVSKVFGDLATAGLTNNIELYSLPAGGVIHAVKIKHSASFTGGTIATYTLSVGIAGTLAKYAGAFNVFQAPGDTVQQISSTVGTENHGAATSIKIAATSTVGNLSAATAGAVDVWLLVSVAV